MGIDSCNSDEYWVGLGALIAFTCGYRPDRLLEPRAGWLCVSEEAGGQEVESRGSKEVCNRDSIPIGE